MTRQAIDTKLSWLWDSAVSKCKQGGRGHNRLEHSQHDMKWLCIHYSDVIMNAMASQITGVWIMYSIVFSCVDQRKHQSSASLAIVRGIHRWPVNYPHKGPVTRKTIPFDDVTMWLGFITYATKGQSSNGLRAKTERWIELGQQPGSIIVTTNQIIDFRVAQLYMRNTVI